MTDIATIVSRKCLLAAANGVVPVSWEDMRLIDSRIQAMADALSKCRTALSYSHGAMKAITDVFPNADVARDGAKYCADAIKAIDSIAPPVGDQP